MNKSKEKTIPEKKASPAADPKARKTPVVEEEGCAKPHVAESARFNDEDEGCNDGVN